MKTYPKIGTAREDGLVFGGKAPKSKSGEWWTTPEKLAARLEKNRTIRASKSKQYEIGIKRWREANPDKVKAQKARGHAKRRADRKKHREANPISMLTPDERRIRKNIRQRTTQGIKYHGWDKSHKTQKTIGCTWLQLKNHIQSQFQTGMNWANYGQWHIDHIFPLSKAENAEHLIELCRYTNLQPLWARDNISKGSRIP